MHADMPLARERYARLIALDSTIADAWSGLGDASWLDLTLRTDARGREYLPADLTLALQAYERALELAATDHRVYPQLANLLIGASLEQERILGGFREPPPGNVQTLNLRTPVRYYATLLVGDSLLAVPSDSIGVRYGSRVDSLRSAARTRARGVLDRWLTVAPDEGQAHLWLAMLQSFDRDYDAALRSLAAAESLGVASPVPFPVARLGFLLEARRWDRAAELGDSLLRQPDWGADAPPGRLLASGALANWLLVSGRPEAAIARGSAYFAALGAFDPTPRMRREVPILWGAVQLRLRAGYGLIERAALADSLDALERRIEDAPEDERARLREVAGWSGAVASALVGDTAGLRHWRAVGGRRGRQGLEALATLLAGDRAAAERMYAAAARDTSRTPSHLFALGRTAEGLGRPEEALRWYTAVDTASRVMGGGSIDPDWPLVARAYAHAGGAAEALGRTEDARRFYRTALDLWRNAEPALREQREVVARALGELDRVDRPDRPSAAGRP
jgi:tetratricopeptide (TPR) repeat protein